MFRPLGDEVLLPVAAKVPKNARRNLRFLYFRARYVCSVFDALYHTFTQDVLYRFIIELTQQQRRCR